MFVQYLTGEAQNMTKLERKPRRNIQYKDMGKPASIFPFLSATLLMRNSQRRLSQR